MSKPSTLPLLRWRQPWLAVATAVSGLFLLAAPAGAERGDRNKPMTIEADKPGVVDLQRQLTTFNGNVVISQGSLSLRAERIEVRETAAGWRNAQAIGAPGKPALVRQKRDVGDEWVEGSADVIEFDARSDTLKLQGNAVVRRLRGGTVADEITGALITWDNAAEQFTVAGSAPSANAPGGRVRAVLAPRGEAAASAPR
jgi:lipopolysaccharide export system protein LptA